MRIFFAIAIVVGLCACPKNKVGPVDAAPAQVAEDASAEDVVVMDVVVIEAGASGQ